MGAGESNAMGAGRAGASSSRQWAPYLEAACGFKNHWYPALFSHELKDNYVKGVLIAGHEIALRGQGQNLRATGSLPASGREDVAPAALSER